MKIQQPIQLVQLIVKSLSNNSKIYSKPFILEIVSETNVKYSLLKSSKDTIDSKNLQKFVRDLYYQTSMYSKENNNKHIYPFKLEAISSLAYQEHENFNYQSGDVLKKILDEKIIVKNENLPEEYKLTLKEVVENFYFEDESINNYLSELMLLYKENNFEDIKQESNMHTDNNENQKLINSNIISSTRYL